MNNARPTSLIEHVIQFDGSYKALPIAGEDGSVADIEFYGKNVELKVDKDGGLLYYEGSIEIENYVNGRVSEEKERGRSRITLTLTIGMNMPVDVMLLYDHEIRRTDGSEHLTNQEYKNFVGRAGRLGQKI